MSGRPIDPHEIFPALAASAGMTVPAFLALDREGVIPVSERILDARVRAAEAARALVAAYRQPGDALNDVAIRAELPGPPYSLATVDDCERWCLDVEAAIARKEQP